MFSADLDPANTYLIVDECDYFGSGNNVTAHLGADIYGDGHTNAHLIENLAVFSHFKMIFGFCPSFSTQLVRRIRANVPEHQKILQFPLGSLRGFGEDTEHKIQYVERNGYSQSAMFVDTLHAIEKIL